MQSLESVWQQITREFEAAQDRAGVAARARVTDELNQLARRLKQYGSEEDWYGTILDGAARFSREAALFEVTQGALALRGARNLELPTDLQIPLDSAKAFASAVASGDPAVVLCSKGEVSEAIAGAVSVNRGFAVPISNESRRAAVLFGTIDEGSEVSALELIAQIASAVLKRRADGISHVQIAAATSAPRPAIVPELDGAKKEDKRGLLPDWASLPTEERMTHVRAKRMARTKVAAMALYKPEACKAGRARRDVYLFLKREIDAARDVYRAEFLSTKSMVDYLHCELLRQLAENDESILGADYPGQMA